MDIQVAGPEDRRAVAELKVRMVPDLVRRALKEVDYLSH